MIPTVLIGEDIVRTNLFVVDPNEHVLSFALHVNRRSPDAPGREETYAVLPKSTAVIPIGSVFDPECQFPVSCGFEHRLTFVADGPYYAMASSIVLMGDARIGSPVLLAE
jgi:hypothetical protein